MTDAASEVNFPPLGVLRRFGRARLERVHDLTLELLERERAVEVAVAQAG
jgi:hypothetical protein